MQQTRKVVITVVQYEPRRVQPKDRGWGERERSYRGHGKPNVGDRVRGFQKLCFSREKDFFWSSLSCLVEWKPNSFGFLSGVYFSTRDWGDIQEITALPSQTLQSYEDTALKSWFTIPESSSLTKKRKEKQKETITENEMLINVLQYEDRLLDPTSFSCHSELWVPLALCSFP